MQGHPVLFEAFVTFDKRKLMRQQRTLLEVQKQFFLKEIAGSPVYFMFYFFVCSKRKVRKPAPTSISTSLGTLTNNFCRRGSWLVEKPRVIILLSILPLIINFYDFWKYYADDFRNQSYFFQRCQKHILAKRNTIYFIYQLLTDFLEAKQKLAQIYKNYFMIPQKTYPEDYSCIVQPKGQTGGLYIGNLQAAQNTNTLQKHSIKAVLTASKGIDLKHPKHLIPYMLYIPADDHQSFNISTYFDKAADFIASALEKTNVMVHCLAGVSRSVSLVLSYFIKHKSYTYEQAYNLVKSKRRIIHPNDGFIAQLKSFSAKLGISERKRSPSPQHRYSISPQKLTYNNYITPETSQFRRSSLGGSLKKHCSINQTLNQQTQFQSKFDYKKYQREIPSYENNKYQIISKDPKNYQSLGRIKRLSSLNIPTMELTQNERRQSYGIFNNISNKQSPTKMASDVTDIDRKIEEIRKKYSEMSGYQMNYTNYKGVSQNRTNGENNYQDRWARPDNKRDYKYLPQYDNIVKTRQYQQYRPTSSNLYPRDS